MFKFLCVLLLVAAQDALANEPNIQGSYWELARDTVGPSLLRALTLLPSILKQDSCPDDVKTLRVALLESRELLDVFSFAYPKCKPDNAGTWTCTCKHDGLQPPPSWPASPPPASHHGKGKKGHDHEDHHGSKHGHRGRSLMAARAQSAHRMADPLGDELVGGKRKHDLLLLLRKDLDEGYEVIGDFQDLAHSLVAYNESDADAKRTVCLDWQARMLANAERYDYLQFAANPCNHTLTDHAHVSKLFWGYNGHVPRSDLNGEQNLAVLVRDCQLQQLMDNYTTLLELETIWVDPDHAQFHLFRKEIRSVLAMLQFFPGLVPDRISDLSPSSHHHPDGPEPQTAPSTHMQPHADSALAALWEEAVGAAKAAAAAVVQALQRARAGLHRLGTDGGASDGSDNLPDEEIKGGSAGSSGSIRGGAARRLGAGQSTVSKKKHTDDDGDKDGDDDDVCSVPDAGDECYYGLGDGSCKPWCVFPLLARVKLGLGDINDKIFAYEFYGTRGMPNEAEAARRDVMRDWRTLRGCMRTWQFPQQVTCLMRSLPPTD